MQSPLFEVDGYRPRDEDVYLMYGRPGRMVGRLHFTTTARLFLFVFIVDDIPLPTALGPTKEMLRNRYADGGWECPRILQDLNRTEVLYFDSVSQIRMNSSVTRSRGPLRRRRALRFTAGGTGLLPGDDFRPMCWQANFWKPTAGIKRASSDTRRSCANDIHTKQQGAKRFAAALAPRTQLGLLTPQLGDEGIRRARLGAAGDRKGNYRRNTVARLSVAVPEDLTITTHNATSQELPSLAPQMRSRGGSNEHVGHDEDNADPCRGPTYRSHAGRSEGVCGDLNNPRDNKQPGSNGREGPSRMSHVHKKQRREELRKRSQAGYDGRERSGR
ncbi:hypothetical protein ACVOMV_17330 [Mesorhizobium atlanticum]